MANLPIIERIRGERITADAARSFLMDDPERVFMVEQGHLDIFVVELRGDEPVNRRRFVARVPADSMAFGSERVTDPTRSERVFGFLAVPSLDAVLIAGERAGVAADTFDLAATTWIDDWIARLSEFPVRGRPVPLHAELLEADPDVGCRAGAVLSAQHGDIVWVSANSRMRWLGRDDMVVDEGEALLPITERTWFDIEVDSEVTTVYTPTALLTERLWPAFLRFGARILGYAILAEAEAEVEMQSRRRRARGARRASVTRTLEGLGEVLGVSYGEGRAGQAGQTPLLAAVRLVAQSCGVSAEVRERSEEQSTPVGASEVAAVAESLARRAGIRTRRITLVPGWWRRDGPSFVGFTESDERPLGVLSNRRGGYRAVDPESGAGFAVNRRRAAGIASEGLAFYPPLPDDVGNVYLVPREPGDRRGRRRWSPCCCSPSANVALYPAPACAGLPDRAGRRRAGRNRGAPGSDPDRAGARGVHSAGQRTGVGGGAGRPAAARLRQRGLLPRTGTGPAADRGPHRRAPAGRYLEPADLLAGAVLPAIRGWRSRSPRQRHQRRPPDVDGNRGAGGDKRSLLDVQFGVAVLLPLAACAVRLRHAAGDVAAVVAADGCVMAVTTCVFSYGQVRHYRDVFRMQGSIDGFVLQMIDGVSKLRVANAESHALAHWAGRFSEQKRASLLARRWAAGQHAVTGMFQPLALAAIYGFVYYAGPTGGAQSGMGLADFLSFNAAFGQLTAAVNNLTVALTTAVGVIPLLERVKPVLDERPELAGAGIDPGDLEGDIEFSNVTFRYAARTPNAIEDVSFRIRQGEYVAFVGPSGCGKSTIYRLLLGFEQPTSGSVFLDGHDLSGLDMVAVRQRMGVVLQHGQLVAGSIYENIAGMSPLSADDAWAAARSAALEDDIRAMPMEMRTVVPADGAGLSVGQKQRLLIARALARRPRVLLFDEATSALDNRAQAVVQASLTRLSATRVVIAHRLSSIRAVDRIFVLDGGRIVESGGYDELIARGGTFAALARRQLVQT